MTDIFDHVICEPNNILGIVPVFGKEDNTDVEILELGDSKELKTVKGTYKRIPKELITFNNVGFDIGETIKLSKTTFTKEWIDKAIDMAKVFFTDKPEFFLQYDKEKKEYKEDNPCLIQFNNLVFILAPIIEQGELNGK